MSIKSLTTLEVISIIAYVFLTILGIFATYTIDEFTLRVLIMPIVSALIIMDLSHRYHYEIINKNVNQILNMLLLTFMLIAYI